MQSYKSKAFAVQEILDGGLVDSYSRLCFDEARFFIFGYDFVKFYDFLCYWKKKNQINRFFSFIVTPFFK